MANNEEVWRYIREVCIPAGIAKLEREDRMPYIKERDRELLDPLHPDWKGGRIDTPGELNYLFSALASNYIETKGLSYQTINDIVGALEGAKCEFYRRIAIPYENIKIKENGDVY